MIDFIILLLAFITISSAIYVVTSKNLVRSAVALFFTLFGIAGLYILLYADFVAGAQILIYVGGILVLIIFGVMLTNKMDKPSIANSSQNQIVAGGVSIVFFIAQVIVILNTEWMNNGLKLDQTVKDIGRLLMKEYLLPFEIVSILLLAALIGSALLSRKI